MSSIFLNQTDLSVSLLFSTVCAFTRIVSGPLSRQKPKTLKKKIIKTITIRYLLHLPAQYGKDNKKWPLLLFLHGAGERGNDLEMVKRHGPPKIIEQKKDLPFITISPQCPPDQWWSSDVLIALVDEILSKYKADEDRIYITGLSMGGFGVWNLAIAYPDRFAAIVPICGGGRPFEVCRIKHVPVWVFHGAKDTVVPVTRSKEMVNTLRACGGKVKFTVYTKTGHDAWTKTYDNPKLYDWLLEQKRSTPEQGQR